MYNNSYIRPYNNLNQQNIYEQIDSQINQLQQMREQMKNNSAPPAINQTFQLAPTGTNSMKFVNTIEDVTKEVVYGETPFFSKDMSLLWVKNIKGNIKSYELNEIMPKDEKDIQIELLQSQINELRKEMRSNEQFIANDNTTEDTADTAEHDETIGKSIKENKPTSVQRISTSKKK